MGLEHPFAGADCGMVLSSWLWSQWLWGQLPDSVLPDCGTAKSMLVYFTCVSGSVILELAA